MVQDQRCGLSSIRFENPPIIEESACVVGQKEGEGPLGKEFDRVVADDRMGKKSWEEAESSFQEQVLDLVLEKGEVRKEDIRYLFAGDLENQMTASSFGLMGSGRPFFGVYGACSTMGETMALGAMTIAGGYAKRVACVTSSHFASAERAFRFPLNYANQRPFSATWTVTGAGAVILRSPKVVSGHALAKIVGVTPGRMVDYGIKDTNNMGAAMAPAAADTIHQALTDFQMEPEEFDKIITGDLGLVGQRALLALLEDHGQDIHKQHMDCGMEIFDHNTQDTHAGGSGCGCAGSVLCGPILRKMKQKEWKRILFVPTGALLSQVSFHEGKTIPSIAHAIMIEAF